MRFDTHTAGIQQKSLKVVTQSVNIKWDIMSTKRTHIIIPEPLVSEIDRLVGKRGRSEFLAQAAEKELRRLQQIKALERASGSWKDKDHAELKSGSSQWVSELRKESERRFRKAGSR
jgi:Arc/MetJ-type ribon-helix-helix transcriptional regulator